MRTEITEQDSTISIGAEETLFNISDLQDFDVVRDEKKICSCRPSTKPTARRSPSSSTGRNFPRKIAIWSVDGRKHVVQPADHVGGDVGRPRSSAVLFEVQTQVGRLRIAGRDRRAIRFARIARAALEHSVVQDTSIQPHAQMRRPPARRVDLTAGMHTSNNCECAASTSRWSRVSADASASSPASSRAYRGDCAGAVGVEHGFGNGEWLERNASASCMSESGICASRRARNRRKRRASAPRRSASVAGLSMPNAFQPCAPAARDGARGLRARSGAGGATALSFGARSTRPGFASFDSRSASPAPLLARTDYDHLRADLAYVVAPQVER